MEGLFQTRGRRAAEHRRLARPRDAADALRHQDPAPAQPARLPRSERGRARAGRVAAGRPARSAHRPRRLPDHGRHRHRPRRAGRLVLDRRLAQPAARPSGDVPGRWLLRALVVATPLGFVAIEAGWVVTEVGRQPWIIYQFMRTSEAVTPVPNQFIAFGGFTIVYVILAVTLLWLLIRLGRTPLPPEATAAGVPVAPTPRERGGLAPCPGLTRDSGWPSSTAPSSSLVSSSTRSSAAPTSAAASGTCWPAVRAPPQQRQVIAHAIGPIWEANHVWLIFVIVLVFTVFPPVFAALSIALYIPLSLALLGIVFRGAAFIFRTPARGVAATGLGARLRHRQHRHPGLLRHGRRGGRLRADPARRRHAVSDPWRTWLAPFPDRHRSAGADHLRLPGRRLPDPGDDGGAAGGFPPPRPGRGRGLRPAGGPGADPGAPGRPLDLAESHRGRGGRRGAGHRSARSSPAGRSSTAATGWPASPPPPRSPSSSSAGRWRSIPTWSCPT